MLYHRFLKLSHLLKSKVFQSRTLNRLNHKGGEGHHIVQAFVNTLKKKNTAEEEKLFEKLRQFRRDLSRDDRKISFEEIGSDTKMSVAEISRRAASPEIWARFFYELAKKKSVKNILEIGTNLGVSGQYFIKALEGKEKAKFITLEGVKGLCEIASERFNTLSLINRFEVLHGLYDETLPGIINNDTRFDLVFIDGNHQYESTLNYFELLKNNLIDQALVIFDDIHWSDGMRRAWKEICTQKGIVFSINFFKLGMVVFNSKNTGVSQADYELFISV